MRDCRCHPDNLEKLEAKVEALSADEVHARITAYDEWICRPSCKNIPQAIYIWLAAKEYYEREQKEMEQRG